MKHKYIKITKKLYKLKNEQEKETQHTTNNFYKRIENLTNISFTHQETQLLRYIFPPEDGHKTETCSGY
jgi:hypothetical protein